VHGVVVTRIDAEGRTHDVTGEAKFSSSNPELLRVDSTGRCEAVARWRGCSGGDRGERNDTGAGDQLRCSVSGASLL
jgi:hypothetical protein